MKKTFEETESERAASLILKEYRKFQSELVDDHKKTLKVLYAIEGSLEELKAATMIAVGKLLSLKEGDHISISADGSYTINRVTEKEETIGPKH